jgi:methionine aminopeptidase
MVKDASEIQAIRDAIKVIEDTYDHISHFIQAGMTERDIAVEIDCFMRKAGAKKEGFDTIVASGPRGALPHGQPSDRRIEQGDMIVMDFGALLNGYTLDLIGRKAIQKLEGPGDKDLGAYGRYGSEKYLAMVEEIRSQLSLTTLKYQRLEDLVASIGLPKEKLCTHCWDGTSTC